MWKICCLTQLPNLVPHTHSKVSETNCVAGMRVNIREARAWEHSPQGSLQHVLICAALLVGISFSLERLTIFVYRHPLSACASVSRSRVRQPAWQAWRTCCLSTHISNCSSGLRFPQFFLYIDTLSAENHVENCVWQVLCLETTARTAPKASVRAARVPTRRTRATQDPATRCCRSSRRTNHPRAAWRHRRMSLQHTRPTSSRQVRNFVH